jgi:hypothetical protein
VTTTRGVIYVHAAPAALTPHLEWAVAGVLDPDDVSGQPGPVGVPAGRPLGGTAERGHASAFEWTDQSAEPGAMRAEIAWEGPAGTAGRMASALRGWPKLRFEVTEEASPGNEGERYAWTPRLGMFRAAIGPHGDIQVGEDLLRACVSEAIAERRDLATELEALMGQPWDEELEPLRYAGEGAPIRILHRAI